MRHLILLTCVAFTISLCLSGCISNRESLEITCDRFFENKHFTWNTQVQPGDSLFITLCSNPTTGFQWSQAAQISDENILELIGQGFTPPKKTAPGAAGTEDWTFKALKSGTSTVLLEYSRPWDGGEKGEWTLTATVVVN